MMNPKFLYLPEASSSVIVAVVGSPWKLLLLWLLVINFLTFLIFGIDKRKAKRKLQHPSIRRIPENVLFLLSALGGSAGALIGMRVWHHKTLHASFRFGIPAILAIQLILILGLRLYFSAA